MSAKLNWLSQTIQPGSLVLQSWLSEHEISPQLAQKYVKNGSLLKLRSGVYVRAGKAPKWFNAVSCLTEQLRFPIHLAGLSSLTHQGKAHYVQLTETSIWLEIPPKKVLPLWFRTFPTHAENSDPALNNSGHQNLENLSNSKHPNWLLVSSNKLTSVEPTDLIDIDVNGVMIKASSAELAAFELLGAVPTSISFEHAAEVFQGLTSLSPKKVQSLLARSNTIKTNRLYLFLAHYYQHPWISRIDESLINIGSGKRQIVTGGKLNQQYQITIPEAFASINGKY